MVKGVSKQVILVRPQGEAAFEQAIFIVRDDAARITEKELLHQAGAAMQDPARPRLWKEKVLPFLSGAGLMGLSWLLSALI